MTQGDSANQQPVHLRELVKGDWFGERALQGYDHFTQTFNFKLVHVYTLFFAAYSSGWLQFHRSVHSDSCIITHKSFSRFDFTFEKFCEHLNISGYTVA